MVPKMNEEIRFKIMSKKNCFLLGDKSKEETKEEKLPELWNGEKIFCP